MLTQQDVITAYKLLLGREPESAAIVQNFADHLDFDSLREVLLSSGEFGERVARNSHVLGASMVVLSMTAEVRNYQRRLQTVMSLALPLWNSSVFLVGDEFASFAPYFTERKCKVTVAVSGNVKELLQRAASPNHIQHANLSIEPLDFLGPQEPDAERGFDLVQGVLSDHSSEAMFSWLDNAAACCAGTLIVEAKTAPGHLDEVFMTPSRVTNERRRRSIPTRRWLHARLRERFEHVYSLSRLAAAASGSLPPDEEGVVETEETFVASREALVSSILEEAGGR